MGSQVEVTYCSEDKRKKRVLDGVLLWQITSQFTRMTFMGLDFEADKPRIKAQLRVMMAIKIKLN